MSDIVSSPELARDEGRNLSFSSPELARDEGRNTSLYEPRTYRGGDLDELLPKIREELGPDAMVVRQREGLQGGIGGFFQRKCVEVVARRATPSVNVLDDSPAEPELEPQSPAIREIMRVASPFVEQLHAAQEQAALRAPEAETVAEPVAEAEPAIEPERVADPEPVAGVDPFVVAPARFVAPREPEPEPAADEQLFELERVAPALPEPAPRTGAAAAHERALVAAGIAPALAAEIVGATVSHAVPFAPNRAIKHLLRDALAARIPVAAPVAPGARTIAFVGSGGAGKTLCATRLADAYRDGSDLEVRVVDLADGQAPERAGAGHVLTVVDTPAIAPSVIADVRALARRLKRIGDCEVHVAVPATLSAAAVGRLLDGLAPLKPTAIALTHLDEVDHAGPVIDAAIARGLALSFHGDATALAPADPAALAAGVLP
jgi:flagellar biosynthesis GTPase FlhF